MKQPVKLPSGRTIDLARCVALLPVADTEYDLVLEGMNNYLRLANTDAVILEDLLAKDSGRATFLNESHLDRERQHQIERNRSAIANFEQIMVARQQEPSDEAAQFFTSFTAIVDAERPLGQKLFTDSEISK